MSLDDTIRRLAAVGELTYLSVIPVAGNGKDGVVFSATYSSATKWGHGTARHEDPVTAIERAIEDHKVKNLAKKLKIDETAEDEPWLR